MRTLIVDDLHPSFQRLMIHSGIDYEYKPDIERSEIRAILSSFEGLIIRSKTYVDAELLSSADQLRFVARAGAGTDNIDVDYLRSSGIELINAPEGNRDAVGDHTVGLILALTKNLVKSNSEVNAGLWDREGNRGIELNSQTVAIIGFGNAGSQVARRLHGFGPRILVYDKYKTLDPDEPYEQVELDEIFEHAQIVTFHVPLTAQTRFMLNREFFDQFQHNIWVVNTARGEILDTKALVTGLKSGRILGAALDVLENEKLDNLTEQQSEMFKYLQNSKKTILTPHVGGWSFESYERINEVLVGKIRAFVRQNS